ncbi:MAG: hypothetical protein J0M17_11110 [Planctomycetes bacterium]|nr:hypothetical protein [Planctomycetota bacterium]
MGDSHREREDKAFEAFIVSQVRRKRDISNLDDLPELTDAERAAMNKLPADLVDKLWERLSDVDDSVPDDEACEDVHCGELAGAGMNRAEEMDDETRKKIAEARKKMADEIQKRIKEKDGRDGKP